MTESMNNLSPEELASLRAILNKMDLPDEDKGDKDSPEPSTQEHESQEQAPEEDSALEETSNEDAFEEESEGDDSSEYYDEDAEENPNGDAEEDSDDNLEDFVDYSPDLEIDEEELSHEARETKEGYEDEEAEDEEVEKSEPSKIRSSSRTAKKKSRKGKKSKPKTARERRRELKEKKREEEERDQEETVEGVSYVEVEERLREVVGDEGEIMPITWEIIPPEDKYDVPLLIFYQNEEEVFSLALTEKTARSLRTTTDSALYYYMSERREVKRKQSRKKYDKLSPPKKVAFSVKRLYDNLRFKYGRLAIFGAVVITTGFIVVLAVSGWTMFTNSDIYYSITH